MAVIIGAGTQVTGATGVISVSWDLNPNVERLWELGSFTPYRTRIQLTQSVNLTIYAGGMNRITVYPPSTTCENSGAILDVNVIPATCDTSVASLEGPFYLTSYSYSKGDPVAYGQETYAGQEWIDHETFPEPSYVLLGITEGQYQGTLAQDEMGVHGGTTDAQGLTGSVSAGFPGIGQADDTYFLTSVEQVGEGLLGDSDVTGAGKYGTASVSVPHTPIWVE